MKTPEKWGKDLSFLKYIRQMGPIPTPPLPPPPPTQMADNYRRENTHGVLLLAIYATMIYTAPCVMLLMRAASITRASVRGPRKSRLFWAL
jgi:hypothetical protein